MSPLQLQRHRGERRGIELAGKRARLEERDESEVRTRFPVDDEAKRHEDSREQFLRYQLDTAPQVAELDDLVTLERNGVGDGSLGLSEDVVDVVDPGHPVVVYLDLLGEVVEQRVEALGLVGPGGDVLADVDGSHLPRVLKRSESRQSGRYRGGSRVLM